jgi:hypothetical protein
MNLRLWLAVGLLFLTRSVTANYFAFRTDYPAAYDVSGFDWLSRLEVFRIFDGAGKSHTFEKGGRSYSVVWSAGENRITVLENGNRAVDFALLPLLEKLRGTAAPVAPQATLTLETASPRYRARLVLEDISLEWSEATPVLHHLKADLLFHRMR